MHFFHQRWSSLVLVICCGLPLQAQAEITIEDVNLRIATFDDIDRIFKALRFNVVNQRTTDRPQALSSIGELIQLSYRLPGLFDEPSSREHFPQSRARPEIWTRKGHYDDMLNEFIDNLENIQQELQAGRMTQAGQLIDRTAQGCRRCHNAFRYR